MWDKEDGFFYDVLRLPDGRALEIVVETAGDEMRVTLDGKPLPGAGTTLGSALSAARHAAGAGRVVVEAVADGGPVAPAVLENPPTRDPFARELRLSTQDVGAMLTGALSEVAAVLRRAADAQPRLARLIHEGRLLQAVDGLPMVLEAWGQAQRTMEVVEEALASASGVKGWGQGDRPEARELADLARARGLLCCVTYNYSGYPMVRQAAEMVASGELGAIRKVVVEYHQGWLAAPLEQTGQKQAAWRTDPKRSGGGAIGDIGVHAEQLARFITGLEPVSLCADITTHVPGRQVDDDGCVLLKYPNGARGSISFSQVCVGEQNGLSIRVFGERGGLRWRQESPDELVVLSLDSPTRLLTRGGPGLGARAAAATRIPPGHPEGYLEGFANIYRGVAEWIMCARANKPTGPLAREIPTIEDGLKGVRFMELAVQSSALGGVWAGTRT